MSLESIAQILNGDIVFVLLFYIVLIKHNSKLQRMKKFYFFFEKNAKVSVVIV